MVHELFKDKTYDEMEWLAKACEPYVYSFNKVFTALPDEVELTFEHFEKAIKRNSSSYLYFYTDDTLTNMMTVEQSNIVSIYYELEVSDSIEINMTKKTMRGEAKLKKLKRTLDDKDLETIIADMSYKYFSNIIGHRVNKTETKRLNDIIELLEIEGEARTSRSPKRKLRSIHNGLKNIMKENKFKIKDVDLANNFCKWVGLFLRDGNLAAYKNICTLKILTHEGMPIYSISEDEV